MDRMVRKRMDLEETGLHTHIVTSPKGTVMALAKTPRFNWKKFLFFQAYGPDYPFAAMPELRKYAVMEKEL